MSKLRPYYATPTVDLLHRGDIEHESHSNRAAWLFVTQRQVNAVMLGMLANSTKTGHKN
jgi:hypothetical protein